MPAVAPPDLPLPPDASPPNPETAGWRWLLQGERPIWLLCGLLVVIGAWLRARHLALPAEFSFDERHFVKNARRYLAATADQNDHPPLGKLLIAGSIQLFGDYSVGWRLPSLLAGWLNIGLAGALGRVLFRDRLAGALAAALVAADGFFLVYSRTALLDGVLVAFILGSALALSADGGVGVRRPWQIGLAAVLAGMACCVKFSGIVLLVPLGLALLAARASLPAWAPVLLALLPLTYGAIFSFALHLSKLPAGPVDVVAATRRLVEVHLGKSDWENHLVSHWYTWFLPLRPVIMRWERDKDVIHAMLGLGNLAVWWGSELLLLGAAWDLLRGGPRALVARFLGPVAAGTGFFGVHARAVGWLCLLWLLPLVPWMITTRDAYLYHYLPSYGFGAVLLAGGMAWLFRARPRLGWLALGVVIAVSLLYLPVWIELPISRAYWHMLAFLKSWR